MMEGRTRPVWPVSPCIRKGRPSARRKDQACSKQRRGSTTRWTGAGESACASTRCHADALHFLAWFQCGGFDSMHLPQLDSFTYGFCILLLMGYPRALPRKPLFKLLTADFRPARSPVCTLRMLRCPTRDLSCLYYNKLTLSKARAALSSNFRYSNLRLLTPVGGILVHWGPCLMNVP